MHRLPHSHLLFLSPYNRSLTSLSLPLSPPSPKVNPISIVIMFNAFQQQRSSSLSPSHLSASISPSADSDLIFSMSPLTPSPISSPLPQNRLLKRTSASSTIIPTTTATTTTGSGGGSGTTARSQVRESHRDDSPLPALPKRLVPPSTPKNSNSSTRKDMRGSENECDFMYSLPRSFTPHPLLKRAATVRPSVSISTQTQAHNASSYSSSKTVKGAKPIQKETTPTPTRLSRTSTTPKPRGTRSNTAVTANTNTNTNSSNTRMYREAYPSPPPSPSPSPPYVSVPSSLSFHYSFFSSPFCFMMLFFCAPFFPLMPLFYLFFIIFRKCRIFRSFLLFFFFNDLRHLSYGANEVATAAAATRHRKKNFPAGKSCLRAAGFHLRICAAIVT